MHGMQLTASDCLYNRKGALPNSHAHHLKPLNYTDTSYGKTENFLSRNHAQNYKEEGEDGSSTLFSETPKYQLNIQTF